MNRLMLNILMLSCVVFIFSNIAFAADKDVKVYRKAQPVVAELFVTSW